MTKKMFFFILNLIILTLPFGSSYASYYAWQYIEVEVVSLDNEIIYDRERERHTIKAIVLVTKLGEGGGHSRNHCVRFLNQKKEALLRFKNIEDAKKIKAGIKLEIKYYHSNSLGYDSTARRMREYRGESWDFIKFL